MRNFYIVVIALLLLGSANNAEAFRCGNTFIKKGDSILKILEYCGNPLYSDYTTYKGRIAKLYIYKFNNIEQRVFLRAGYVIGVL